jgi:hypothetical protein
LEVTREIETRKPDGRELTAGGNNVAREVEERLVPVGEQPEGQQAHRGARAVAPRRKAEVEVLARANVRVGLESVREHGERIAPDFEGLRLISELRFLLELLKD